MPPMTASARSLRIRCTSLPLPGGLRRLRLVEPMERGAQVVDDEAGGRLGHRSRHGAAASLGDDEDAATVEPDLDPGDIAAGADVGCGREQLGGDPGQLLAPLGRARSSRARSPSRRGSPRRRSATRASAARRVPRSAPSRPKLPVGTARGDGGYRRPLRRGLCPASVPAKRARPPARGANWPSSSRRRARRRCSSRPRARRSGRSRSPPSPRRSGAIVPLSVPSATTSSSVGPIATITQT